MFGKTKIALSAAMVLSTAFPASAATEHHRVTHAHPAIDNTAPAARSDQYPTLDTAQVCHGITEQSDLEAGLRAQNFDECMKAEQATREQITKQWSQFSADAGDIALPSLPWAANLVTRSYLPVWKCRAMYDFFTAKRIARPHRLSRYYRHRWATANRHSNSV
jgi:hypothetical protein